MTFVAKSLIVGALCALSLPQVSQVKAESWQAPKGGLAATNKASLLYVQHPSRTIAIYASGGWGLTSKSSSNPVAKSFQIDDLLKPEGNQPKGTPSIVVKSSDLSRVDINGTVFETMEGSVFRVTEAGKVIQLPFHPLKPGMEYLGVLSEYFEVPTGHGRTDRE